MTDSYNRTIDYLRLSVTDRCNLRCIYCMPSKGVQWVPHGDVLRFEEIVHLVRSARSGNPPRTPDRRRTLVREGILISPRLHALPGIDEIHLTTNGVLLPHGRSAPAGGIHASTSVSTLCSRIYSAASPVPISSP
ncbi:MAG: hypothetical protein ACLUBZ_16770 [Ruthenibacterium lactatiformans]|uniref:hypothetical protein n=1 Tax=Ruthenibacterium lactatiformans TaxID=1550024 RepID=UPI0039934E78